MPEKVTINKGLVQGASFAMNLADAPRDESKRGVNIYSWSQLIGITGKNKQGDHLTTTYDNPYFYLSPEDRIRIVQLCTPVLGVITSRMHRIAGTKWNITTDSKSEDRIVEGLKQMYQVAKEYEGSNVIYYKIARLKLIANIMCELPDMLPDASNFPTALMRWKKRLSQKNMDKCTEIEDWMQEPNANDKWEDFIKKYVFDLMTHGAAALYKEVQNNKIENLHILPGGTVIPVRDRFISSKNAYLQIIDGFDPQIFFNDELCWSSYIPTSYRSYPMVPLEALINKVSESMFFDKLMADTADGTRMPEKMIIINDQAPFGDPDKEMEIPLDINEQKRIEEKLATPVKGGVMTFSGNKATIVDLTRKDTMGIQRERQKDIREEVALVFNMSNMEVNLSGSGDTSGRSTSETQSEIDQGKGVIPILKGIEGRFNRDIFPFRFGWGYRLEFQVSKNEKEEVELMAAKVSSGIWSVNEVRMDDNLDPFNKPEFDTPQTSGQQQQGQPGQLGQQPAPTNPLQGM